MLSPVTLVIRVPTPNYYTIKKLTFGEYMEFFEPTAISNLLENKLWDPCFVSMREYTGTWFSDCWRLDK